MAAVLLGVNAGFPTAAAVGSPAASAPSTLPTPPSPGTYRPPIEAPVSDPFRAPAHRYGAGNRGLEYCSDTGAPVRAIGSGRVSFVGPVAGRLVVSVDHPDGLRSSLTGLASITVSVGDIVHRGQAVGTAGPALHLGVRRAGFYIDPETLFGPSGPAFLVPVPGGR